MESWHLDSLTTFQSVFSISMQKILSTNECFEELPRNYNQLKKY